MSARLALAIALVLLFLLAILVIVVAGLVRRPRREWQVAVMGQAQDVRYVGSSSVRGRPVKPRKVSLDEMWAANSVAQSAYVGAPKLPDRDQVAAALAPAPEDVLSRYRAPATAHVRPVAWSAPVPAPPPPPRDYLAEDSFYEPEVVTGEISLFNAALERPEFDDERWEGVDPAAAEGAPTLGLERAREVLSGATATTANWLSSQADAARGIWNRWQVSRADAAQRKGGKPPQTPATEGHGGVPEVISVSFADDLEDIGAVDSRGSGAQTPGETPESANRNDHDNEDSTGVMRGIWTASEGDLLEEPEPVATEVVVEDLVPVLPLDRATEEPREGGSQEISVGGPSEEASGAQLAPETSPVQPHPPAEDDLERWVTELGGESSLGSGAPRPHWRRAGETGEPQS